MKLTRRQFLKGLAALPVLGKLKFIQTLLPVPHPWAFPLLFPAYFLAEIPIRPAKRTRRRLFLPFVMRDGRDTIPDPNS